MARRRTLGRIQFTVFRDDQTNEEEVDDVEDGNTPYDLFGGPRNLLSWVDCLRSSKSSQFGAGVGKRRGNEDTAEAVEAVEECLIGGMPVLNHQLRQQPPGRGTYQYLAPM